MNIDFNPSHRGMTCTPGFNEETGEYTDLQVGIGHSPASPFAGDEEIPEDQALDPESLAPSDPDDQIADAVIELYGDHMEPILDYMAVTLTDEQIEAYDQAIEDGDWSTVLPLLEQTAAEYFEQVSASAESVQAEIDELGAQEPQGMELAYEHLELAQQQTDPIKRDLFMASAEFHRGNLSSSEAIETLLSKYSIEEVAPIYKALLEDHA